MRLSSIYLNNFRLFKDETFEFKPLTILTGPNSSGKSSVAKSLMLLQENLKAPNYLGRLTFKSGNHRLGSFRSILTQGSTEETVVFQLKYENFEKEASRKDQKGILDNIKFFYITYEFEESLYPENGFLIRYEIQFEEGDGEKTTFLSMAKDNEKKTYDFYLNMKWLINKVIVDKSLPNKPKLYLIWDELNSEHFKLAFHHQSEKLLEQKEKKLRDLEKESIQKQQEIKDEISNLKLDPNSDDEQYSIYAKSLKINNLIKTCKDNYELESAKLIVESDSIEKQMLQVEEEMSENQNNPDLVIKMDSLWEAFYDLDQQKNDLDRNFNQQLQDLEKQLDDLVFNDTNSHLYNKIAILEEDLQSVESAFQNEIKYIEQQFDADIAFLREGNIRSILHGQIGESSQNYLLDLANIPIQGEEINLSDLSISEYLMSRQWGNVIYSLLHSKEGIKVVDAIKWTDQTLFIKNVLDESDTGRELLFGSLITDNGSNLLAEFLIEKIEEIYTCFYQEIPFEHISGMRGSQQRFYQTTHTDYPIEESMAILLNLQYSEEHAKLNFIDRWAKEFGIGERIRAEVVEGDYVRGYIFDEFGHKMNLADKGLGIAEVIPIIIYTANAIGSKKMLCIEEPGSHLHPNLQGKLADFVQDANVNNVFFLIETHSEYFVRNLQFQLLKQQNVDTESILIHYLNHFGNDRRRINLNQDGDLIDLQNGELITSFGEGFLDLATEYIKSREELKKIKEGFTIVVCESNEKDALDSMAKYIQDGRVIFSKAHDNSAVFRIIKEHDNSSGYLGLRDRDYLAPIEVKSLKAKYPNLKILDYYSYESYLYHPDNVSELAQSKCQNFDRQAYVENIKEQFLAKKSKILLEIKESRRTYAELNDKELGKEEKTEGYKAKALDEIMEALESNEFETYYIYFNMKKHFDKSMLETLNFGLSDYYSTNWFREKMLHVIGLCVEEPSLN